jgi:hypothetical protein
MVRGSMYTCMDDISVALPHLIKLSRRCCCLLVQGGETSAATAGLQGLPWQQRHEELHSGQVRHFMTVIAACSVTLHSLCCAAHNSIVTCTDPLV